MPLFQVTGRLVGDVLAKVSAGAMSPGDLSAMYRTAAETGGGHCLHFCLEAGTWHSFALLDLPIEGALRVVPTLLRMALHEDGALRLAMAMSSAQFDQMIGERAGGGSATLVPVRDPAMPLFRIVGQCSATGLKLLRNSSATALERRMAAAARFFGGDLLSFHVVSGAFALSIMVQLPNGPGATSLLLDLLDANIVDAGAQVVRLLDVDEVGLIIDSSLN